MMKQLVLHKRPSHLKAAHEGFMALIACVNLLPLGSAVDSEFRNISIRSKTAEQSLGFPGLSAFITVLSLC